MAHLCPSPPSPSFTTYCSTRSTTSSSALSGVTCHYQVTEKVCADGSDSANLFSQFGLFTAVAHLYSPSRCPQQHHVPSTSCWLAFTAFHLLIIITFTFIRLWGETRLKFPSFTSENFHVAIPLKTLHRPLYMLPAHGPGQKYALGDPTHWQSTFFCTQSCENVHLHLKIEPGQTNVNLAKTWWAWPLSKKWKKWTILHQQTRISQNNLASSLTKILSLK
jgi:hypothetical protein